MRLRRVFRRVGRIFRPIEKFTRKTFDLLDPIIDLDGSKTKKLMQQQMDTEREAMDRAEEREKNLVEEANKKRKFEEGIAKDRRNLNNSDKGLKYGAEGKGEIGQNSGATSLAIAIRKGDELKGNKQSNAVEEDDDIEEALKKFMKKK